MLTGEDNMHNLKDQVSIDRINNDGHYEHGNLRYATKSEQRLNIRG